MTVIVPLQIGVVFNQKESIMKKIYVIVPLQIGVVFNSSFIGYVSPLSYRPLTNRGSL